MVIYFLSIFFLCVWFLGAWMELEGEQYLQGSLMMELEFHYQGATDVSGASGSFL
jgi:hypothetical protein